MKRFLWLFFLTPTLTLAAEPPPRPRLVLTIVIDQFRYDYLTRYREEYAGGFARLLTQGAVFTNARFEHFPTVTATGHSTILTGALPTLSGIIGNDWYDRDAGKQVTSVSDDSVKMLEGSGDGGASPRRLLVDTVGDELKIASGGKSRVIGISIKDRAAILPAGHSADAAYWYDTRTGHFVTSTFYAADLPTWVKEFNLTAASRYRGAEWMGHKLPLDNKAFSEVEATPFANDLVESFAERAIEAEKLGKDTATDLLTVSFSANDYIGHQYGPDSPEVKDLSKRTDQVLDKLFRFIDTQIGMRNVLVVLTADHGVAPGPEAQAARRMPGGRMPSGIIQTTVQKALQVRYGPGQWILSPSEHSLYLNLDLMREKRLDREEVTKTAKEAVASIPHVFRVYTYAQLETGNILPDDIGRLVMNGFNIRRGADLYILLEPYWMFGMLGTTHGSAFGYDTHVPVIFMGPGIRAGRYDQSIVVNDIAPTLATLLGVEVPSGSVGRALAEIFSGK